MEYHEYKEMNLTILEELDDLRVVSYVLQDNNTTVCITERCDGCFSTKITKEQFKKMIDELTLIYNKMT